MRYMKQVRSLILAAALSVMMTVASSPQASARERLKIGVTLHPYYSFAVNIVGDLATVLPLIKPGFNSHAYTPQPDDIKRVRDFDVLIVNGIGHDEFAFEILEAARLKGKLPLIYANEGVSLIPIAGTDTGEKMVNPHTFISITASIQQIYNISKALKKLDPDNADAYSKNTRDYVKRLRQMKAMYMEKLAALPDMDFRCATIHGGYDYLLQEFGLKVTTVIEPGHGLKPTASQLAKTIDKIRDLDVDVVFTEMNFPDKYVDSIQRETGVRIRYLSHLTSGDYTASGFEEGLRANIEALTSALIESHDRRGQNRGNQNEHTGS
ncbi:metal ABC transporter solute-binding protein, Zn/Mn family [Desulfobacter sp.]|uniref:metal ABC transporter solute-binding protein, Zn/Mn family n=1 Tax=Desulfobacter sp. TaxID=2294 RepID=UPI003D133D8B